MISASCKTITVTGVDLASVEGLDSATLSIQKGCECNDEDIIEYELEPDLDPDIEITSGTIILNSFLLGQSEEDEELAIEDGLYKITITTVVDDVTSESYVIAFVGCSLKCKICKLIDALDPNCSCFGKKNSEVAYLVHLYRAIELQSEVCRDFNKACALYSALTKKTSTVKGDCGC